MIGIINVLGVMIIDQCPLARDCEIIVVLIYTPSAICSPQTPYSPSLAQIWLPKKSRTNHCTLTGVICGILSAYFLI